MSGRSKQMEWGMVDEVAATVPSILLWGEGISRANGSSRRREVRLYRLACLYDRDTRESCRRSPSTSAP